MDTKINIHIFSFS